MAQYEIWYKDGHREDLAHSTGDIHRGDRVTINRWSDGTTTIGLIRDRGIRDGRVWAEHDTKDETTIHSHSEADIVEAVRGLTGWDIVSKHKIGDAMVGDRFAMQMEGYRYATNPEGKRRRISGCKNGMVCRKGKYGVDCMDMDTKEVFWVENDLEVEIKNPSVTVWRLTDEEVQRAIDKR